MRLVFFGTSAFAVPALERLAPHIVLVVTKPDRPKGRGLEWTASPVKESAVEIELQVETPPKCRAPEFVSRLVDTAADLFVVASYGQILPQSVLDVPKHGCINLHASILPKHRGASPIQTAIFEGDEETGVTLMKMDAGLDTGGVIASSKTKIDPDETAGELHDRLAVLAADLVHEWIDRLASGKARAVPQDNESATMTHKTHRLDGRLSPFMPATEAHRRFRAFTPYPGSFLEVRSGTLKVRKARLDQDRNGEPGTVLETRPNFVLAFSEGSLVLKEVQPEGKRTLVGSEYANGARIAVGDCLVP